MFNVIDTKAIAKQQNVLKRKYTAFIEVLKDLPASAEDRYKIELAAYESYRNQLKEIVNSSITNEEPEDAEFEEPANDTPALPKASDLFDSPDTADLNLTNVEL